MSVITDARIQIKRDTTAHWNDAHDFIPLMGEIIVYTDYKTIQKEIGGETTTVNVPGIKIGTGNAYVQDLPFTDTDTRNTLLQHIEDMDMHTTLGEKMYWNNKVNIDDSYAKVYGELEEETLVFTRN